jgi:hypothetical protein
LCGRGGIYALGAVVANYMGDLPKRAQFLGQFIEVRSIHIRCIYFGVFKVILVSKSR